ncbi:D-serine ammonia-lyase [Lutispora saccharofermentans]|uniref:Probable D-serine dehydratase n=1 Tax=Lutispora saccharofermentans TaxID=3024236 RepID=A0ABT1NKZ0_9FIRM|nr:D-serine ammonia-lyase [Lutispora saccharofermentans]MCQ1531774.1 D-serine ammonia-lyase [Lutispora saccharofermentans]
MMNAAGPNLMDRIKETKEVFWLNPKYESKSISEAGGLTMTDMLDAEARLKRFAPYIASIFPETAENSGIIESPLSEIPYMKDALESCDRPILGRLLLKCDSHLPISGSIKARGGIYEVLKHAEKLALEEGALSPKNDYSILHEKRFKELFSRHKIAVGSTGNLGLSIGIMSAALGFKVFVHMSSDARQWKKDLLRHKGVTIVEYASDYSKAVEEGRKQSDSDPSSYFIDDENSKDLFLGYSVAALRLQNQMKDLGIEIDENHPLFVYIPCGVGGGPGGVAFGLKVIFGPHVHCFFAEPTHSPCMLVGMMTGLHNQISVQDLGIDNITEADGLAVGRPSGFVGKTMESLLSGIYTVEDRELYKLLATLADTENIYIEPSAAAGFPGPSWLLNSPYGQEYIKSSGLSDKMNNSAHIVWATGGSMVPDTIKMSYYHKGKAYKRAESK